MAQKGDVTLDSIIQLSNGSIIRRYKSRHIMEHVLVTGGMGFIGSYVVELLVEKGYRVTVWDNRQEGGLWVNSGRVGYINLSIQNAVYDEFDHIVHLGAWSNVRESMTEPIKLYANNVMATAIIADMVLRTGTVKSVVFASSSAVESPESHYGVSKAASEMMMNVLNTQVEASVASLRFANVFGARQNPSNGTLIAKFINCIFTGESPTIYGKGMQRRDYIYVGDVAGAILASMENSLSGVMNVSTGGTWSVNNVCATISGVAKNLGMKLPAIESECAKPGDKANVEMQPAKELLKVGWKNRCHLEKDILKQLEWQDNMAGVWEDNHYIDGTVL